MINKLQSNQLARLIELLAVARENVVHVCCYNTSNLPSAIDIRNKAQALLNSYIEELTEEN